MESSSAFRVSKSEKQEENINVEASLLQYKSVKEVITNIETKKNCECKEKIMILLDSCERQKEALLTKEEQKEVEELYALIPWLSQIQIKLSINIFFFFYIIRLQEC